MKFPKVLIFSPTYEGKEYCREKFVEHVNNISYPNKEFIMIDNSEGMDYFNKLKADGVPVHKVSRNDDLWETLAASQNYARNYAINNDFDYVLSLESDVFPPADIIQKLMRRFKPIVGGWYMLGGFHRLDDNKYIPEVPCVFLTEGSGTRFITREELGKIQSIGGIHQVHGMGVGCVLIDIDIIKRYSFWVDNRFNKASDSYFYMDLWNDKIPVFMDVDLEIPHEPNSRSKSMYKKKGE